MGGRGPGAAGSFDRGRAFDSIRGPLEQRCDRRSTRIRSRNNPWVPKPTPPGLRPRFALGEVPYGTASLGRGHRSAGVWWGLHGPEVLDPDSPFGHPSGRTRPTADENPRGRLAKPRDKAGAFRSPRQEVDTNG